MPAKRVLLDYLAQDEIPKVLKGLLTLANAHKDEQLRNSATFQSGRVKALEKQRINGTLSHEEDHVQSAKIRDALLQILKDLPDEWTIGEIGNEAASFAVESKRNWKKYAAYLTAAVALMAGIAELSGYSVRDLFGKKETTELPVSPPPQGPSASTKGANSPAVITHDGDVNINYGEVEPPKDSTTHK